MAANLESVKDTPTDSTNTPSPLLAEVNQDRTSQNNTGSKAGDLLTSAENKVKDLFGSLQLVGDDLSGPSLKNDVAAAPSGGDQSAKDQIASAQKSLDQASDQVGSSKAPGGQGVVQDGATAVGSDTKSTISQDDAKKAAGAIDDGLYWYKADDYAAIDKVLQGKSQKDIEAIDKEFRAEHNGESIKQVLEERWKKDHPDELAKTEKLLDTKDAPASPAQPTETKEQIEAKEAKAIDSMKHDPDVQAKHQEMAAKAHDTMKEPELGKFLKNMDQLEEREAKMQLQYEKEAEAKGKSPADAAKEAEQRAHQEIKDTYTNVEKLLVHDHHAKVSDKTRVELAQQVMHHAADPMSISQGDYNTCTLAVLESRTFTRDPAEASRMVAEVATTGQYTRPGHAPIVLDAESLKRQGQSKGHESATKDNSRDFASQLFEVTTANVGLEQRNSQTNPPGQLRYEQHAPGADKVKDPHDNGERLMDYSTHPPKIVDTSVSLHPDEIAYTSKQISPKGSEGPVMIEGVDLGKLEKTMLQLYAIGDHLNGGKEFDYKDPDWVRKAHESVNGATNIDQAEKDKINKTIDDYDKQSKFDAKGEVLNVHNEQEMKDTLAHLKQEGKLPVIVAVNSNNEPFFTDSGGGDAGGSGGPHVVTITDYDPATGVAKVENQWYANADHPISAKQLFEATQMRDDVIKTEKAEVDAAKAAGHRDYAKEYDLLRLQKQEGQISADEFQRQFVQETIDRAKDHKAGKISDEEFVKDTNEGVMILKKLEQSKDPAEQARAKAIIAAVKAGVAG